MSDGPVGCFQDCAWDRGQSPRWLQESTNPEWDSRIPANLPCERCSIIIAPAGADVLHVDAHESGRFSYALCKRHGCSATVERLLTIPSNQGLMQTKHGPSSQDSSTWQGAVHLVCDRLLSAGKAAFERVKEARMEAEAQQNTRSVQRCHVG